MEETLFTGTCTYIITGNQLFQKRLIMKNYQYAQQPYSCFGPHVVHTGMSTTTSFIL